MKRYLYEQYQIPLHKMNVISYGQEKPVSSNKTKEGRAVNRRVDVRLMTNTVGDTTPTTPTTTGQNNPSSM